MKELYHPGSKKTFKRRFKKREETDLKRELDKSITLLYSIYPTAIQGAIREISEEGTIPVRGFRVKKGEWFFAEGATWYMQSYFIDKDDEMKNFISSSEGRVVRDLIDEDGMLKVDIPIFLKSEGTLYTTFILSYDSYTSEEVIENLNNFVSRRKQGEEVPEWYQGELPPLGDNPHWYGKAIAVRIIL